MGSEFLHLLAVNSGLALLIVLPFIPVAGILLRQERLPSVLLAAFVLGCSLQSVLGTFWSRILGRAPAGELILISIIGSACLLGGAAWMWVRQKPKFRWRVGKDDALLLLIILAALVVRSIHPMEAAFLGQSDAYTHLHYLHNIADNGYLINPAYPPGYHWILALPVMVFSIDPYWVARFGGVFFGVGLVLAIYVLTAYLFNRRAALFSSFLAACFPPMTLLMKNGVGVFANQLGLFLLPCILLFYFQIVAKQNGGGWGIIFLFSLSLCALVASVPMIFFHLFFIILIDRLLTILVTPSSWFSKTVQIFVFTIPAICMLFFHVSQLGSHQRYKTATILMDYSEKRKQVKKMANKVEAVVARYAPGDNRMVKKLIDSPYIRLATDYFMVKRIGFGNAYLNATGCLLLGIFLAFIGYGIVKQQLAAMLIGIWGALTSTQAATGFLQFSSYQREAWSLLIVTCCMGGVLADRIFQLGAKSMVFKLAIGACVISSLAWAVVHPPRHPMIQSGAEDTLIRSVRFLGQTPETLADLCGSREDSRCEIVKHLNPELPLVLVTRKLLGWDNQGEIVANVLQRESQVSALAIRERHKNVDLDSSRQYIFIIDKPAKLKPKQQTSAYAMVSPRMVRASMKHNRYLARINRKIIKLIKNLPAETWQTQAVPISPELTAYVVTPNPPSGGDT